MNYDMMTPESLLLAAPIPTLYPVGTQRELVSVFGMIAGKLGSHVSISDDQAVDPHVSNR